MRSRIVLLIALTALVAGVALVAGTRFINPLMMSELDRQILFEIRMPRVVVALIMGMGLGASGAVLQGMLRNPLADPYVLGLSSGATLMAAAGLMFEIHFLGGMSIPALAFIGAMSTGLMVGGFGYRAGGVMPERLLLAGIGIGFLCSAVLTLLMSVSSSEGLKRAMLWIFGDLGMADWGLVPYGLGAIVLGLGVSLWRGRALNSLMLGPEISHSLGFSPRREVGLLFVSVGVMTAASVSLGGMVGFIGLLVPHIMRYMVGPDSMRLVPASALGGGMLLVVSDFIGRTVVAPMELPAGVVTALIGAPYFLYLLRRRDVHGL